MTCAWQSVNRKLGVVAGPKMVKTMIQCLTRAVSGSLAACELTHLGRVSIDAARARQQHAAYQQALRDLGVAVIELPELVGQPDAVFVEDVAVVLDEVAVLTRPGARSRQAEVAPMAVELARWRQLLRIKAPGTLDGGDVLRIGRRLWVGASGRSNAEGIAQLATLLEPFGYQVQAVPIQGCLHLKSAITAIDEQTVLIQPRWLDSSLFAGFRQINVDSDEPHAANILSLATGGLERPAASGWIYPDNFPRTLERLHAAGCFPRTVAVDELQKAEGAVTCCSLLFSAAASAASG